MDCPDFVHIKHRLVPVIGGPWLSKHFCFFFYQEALKTAPLLGDLEKVRANEEFVPSSKEEKGAAALHTQAIRLFNDDK